MKTELLHVAGVVSKLIQQSAQYQRLGNGKMIMNWK
jgi:hypothetical protein